MVARMAEALSSINRALNLIPKRAEQRQAEQLRATFVDSGVSNMLEAMDHQVLYGRRGTGKTHALRFLEGIVRDRGDIGVFLDLRTIGSPDGLFGENPGPPEKRAAKLLVDLLGQLHEALMMAVIEDDALIEDSLFLIRLDELAAAVTTVRLSGDVEVERQGEESREQAESSGLGIEASLSSGGVRGQYGSASTATSRDSVREVRRGAEEVSLNFSQLAAALRDLAAALPGRRLWVLLDEWSSIPPDVQPFVGEFLVRCVLPLQQVSVKIAAIEQQTRFRVELDDGRVIGIELGADVAANVDLDEFMVFEQNEERSRKFFASLFYKHLTSGMDDDMDLDLASEDDLVRRAFTDRRAFDELVRACEGVPRDVINIAGKAALQVAAEPISVPAVRTAARAWYQSDKEAAVRARREAFALLNWIIDEVIRGKQARGFLVNQKAAETPLLLALFDARVLHIARRGYSAQDAPGERFDVWTVDYGAYVDMLHTKYEPQGLLPVGDDPGEWVEVPTQDLRAIRRAVLDLDLFESRNARALPPGG